MDAVVVIFVFMAVVLAFSAFKVVPQGRQWTVERFGRYTRTLTPGISFLVPFADRVGRRLSMMETVLQVPQQDVITRDNAIVTCDAVVFIQIVDAAGEDRPIDLRRLLGRHQTRENPQPSLDDGEVVIPPARLESANLDHPQPPAFVAVIVGLLLQQKNAVGDALQLPVVFRRGSIVEEEHGALPSGEELLQHHDLAPVAQRMLGQQPQLGERVKNHPAGVRLLHFTKQPMPMPWYLPSLHTPCKAFNES